MKRSMQLIAGLLGLLLSPALAFAQALPDLGGRTVTVVTENAYPPLQFVDPKTGEQVGWMMKTSVPRMLSLMPQRISPSAKRVIVISPRGCSK